MTTHNKSNHVKESVCNFVSNHITLTVGPFVFGKHKFMLKKLKNVTDRSLDFLTRFPD